MAKPIFIVESPMMQTQEEFAKIESKDIAKSRENRNREIISFIENDYSTC